MPSSRRISLLLPLALAFILAVALAACDGGGGDRPPSTEVEDVDAYLQDLPPWSAFSPTQPDQDPAPTGAAVTVDTVEVDVDSIGKDDGQVYTLEDVVYTCETEEYSITQNPREVVMYNPSELLWPGAIIQGEGHTLGSVADLSISGEERAPLNVLVNISNDQNFLTVDQPTKSGVRQAVGSLVDNAVQSGIDTPSSVDFERTVYHSEEQSALEMGLSARYLGYSASAQGSIDREASETTVTAHYYQNMYEVEIDNPASPGDFFSDAFTEEKLQQLQSRGEIGPENLPVYVSKIVYGRMMLFSLTSTASRSDIEGTVNASYDGLSGGGGANLSAQEETILEEAELKVTTIGGNAANAIAAIRSGNWRNYFDEEATLSTAVPLSYTFRNLGDNSIAGVTERTEYEIRTCEARQATPGTFDLQDAATLSVPIATPFSTTTADVDGDGNDDLVFNHRQAANEIAIAFSNGDGTFAAPQVSTHPATPDGGWATADFVTADLENDGSYELIWSRVGNANGENRTYVARATGGSLDFLDVAVHPDTPSQGGGWDEYRTLVGDIDGDGDDDLVWNLLGGRNRTFVGFSNGDGTFILPTTSQNQGSTWFPYHAFVGDVTNDNKADMIWSVTTSTTNGWYVGESRLQPDTDPGDDEYFDLEYNDRGGSGWDDYVTFAGDIDGQNGTDLLFINPTYPGSRAAVHRVLSDGNGSFTPTRGTFLPSPVAAADVRLADVTADGRSDLVAFDRSNPSVYVGLGTQDGIFDFSRAEQTLPQDDWSQFVFLTGDFNGDGLQDVLWTNETPNSRFYVGLSRDDASI